MSLCLKRLFVASLLLFCMGQFGCTPEEGCTRPSALNFSETAELDDGSCLDSLTLTQSELTAVDIPYLLDITGDELAGPDTTIPHILAGPGSEIMDPDSTYRDIYTNIGTLPSNGEIEPGTIIVKRIWYRDPVTGDRLGRANTYVMFKQPKGYYPAGGDWEYIAIKYDEQTDFEAFPNAVLGSALLRGKVAVCAGCHAKQKDFVFGNE